MGKRLGFVAIRLMVSVNLLYAAIFAKFAGIPQSVALFTQMSQAVHGLISQPVFRLGSGVFETTVAVLFLIPKTARLGAKLVILWMTIIHTMTNLAPTLAVFEIRNRTATVVSNTPDPRRNTG